MSNFYSNETPSGVIDGVNTTYTTANNINTIITVTVDGAIYTGTITYTAGTTSFVLADAPTVSITVSYFDSATGVAFDDGILISTLRDAFERRKQDISDVDNDTFYQWCNQINRFIYNRTKGLTDNLSTGNYTVSTAPNSQALPSDFKDMAEFETGIYEVDSNGDDSVATLGVTGHGSLQKGFYIEGSNIIFTGIEDSSSYKMKYLPNLTSITALTDKMLLTEDKLDYLLNALDVRYEIWDSNPSAEAMADQRFVRSLSELLDNISPLPTVYGMDDVTQLY